MFLQKICNCTLCLPCHFEYDNLKFLLHILCDIFVLYFWSKHICGNNSWTLTLRPKVNRFFNEIQCDSNKKEIQLAWSHLSRITLYGFGSRISNTLYRSAFTEVQLRFVRKRAIVVGGSSFPVIALHYLALDLTLATFPFLLFLFLNFWLVTVDTDLSFSMYWHMRHYLQVHSALPKIFNLYVNPHNCDIQCGTCSIPTNTWKSKLVKGVRCNAVF